jgi:hypothetical protein
MYVPFHPTTKMPLPSVAADAHERQTDSTPAMMISICFCEREREKAMMLMVVVVVVVVAAASHTPGTDG